MSRRALFLLSICAGWSSAQEIRVSLMDSSRLLEWLREIPATNEDRSERLAGMFAVAGCGEQTTLSPAKGSKLSNVTCTLTGESGGPVIVVGAHYDKVKAGKGVIDNGTGTVLLPALYIALSKERRHHTFQFVGFTDEEKGLVGSRAYVKQIPKTERSNYRAMVNIDTLGLGPVTAWERHANPNLLVWFERVTYALGQHQITYVNVDNVGDSDSSSFKAANIPVIDFHSITPATFKILHSEDDNADALREQDYVESYRTIANYLAYMDQALQKTPDISKRPSKKAP